MVLEWIIAGTGLEAIKCREPFTSRDGLSEYSLHAG